MDEGGEKSKEDMIPQGPWGGWGKKREVREGKYFLMNSRRRKRNQFVRKRGKRKRKTGKKETKRIIRTQLRKWERGNK